MKLTLPKNNIADPNNFVLLIRKEKKTKRNIERTSSGNFRHNTIHNLQVQNAKVRKPFTACTLLPIEPQCNYLQWFITEAFEETKE